MELKGNPSFVEDVNKLHVVKCVVVGDRGVGKSHLVCAKACGTKYTLRDLVQTHISTVWAVDHYRTNPKVQRRSICTVECCTCSLRLWDTFGNHEKDRQFAYSSADVVLACFSVANRRSLQHIETHWMPEILRMCGHLPVILCACQIDMRYLYKDSAYQELGKEAFLRRLSTEDIVLPEEGKQVAKKLGLYYYETSVLVQYGIDEVFSNCVRAALISKRRGKILVGFGGLKNVVRPHLQVPHMPPRPSPPKVVPSEGSDVTKGDATMLGESFFADVVFIVQRRRIEAHRVFLVAASATFQSFFEEMLCVDVAAAEDEKLKSISIECDLHLQNGGGSRTCSQETLKDDGSSSFARISSSYEINNLRWNGRDFTGGDATYDGSDSDTGISEDDSRGCSSRYLLEDSYTQHNNSFMYKRGHTIRHRSVSARQYQPQNSTATQLTVNSSVSTGELVDCDSMTDTERDSGFLIRTPTVSSSCLSSAFVCRSLESGETVEKVVISVDESITPAQFNVVLCYLYTGEIPEDLSQEALFDLQRITRLLGLDDMDVQIGNMVRGEHFMNLERKRRFLEEKRYRLSAMLALNCLSDVTFELDDGRVNGHRALLSARCEMFSTMFTANFSERSTRVVMFPGVSKDAFVGVLEYLYTGLCPLKCLDWIGLIELTNRLFLHDLLLLAEVVIIKELAVSMETGSEATVESALAMLGPARLHGANQLADWCQWILKVNYKDLIEHNAKVIESFDPDLQSELARDRWPPLWYLTEVAIYEKAILEMNKERPQQSWLRRSDGETCISPGGCLSFFKKKP